MVLDLYASGRPLDSLLGWRILTVIIASSGTANDSLRIRLKRRQNIPDDSLSNSPSRIKRVRFRDSPLPISDDGHVPAFKEPLGVETKGGSSHDRDSSIDKHPPLPTSSMGEDRRSILQQLPVLEASSGQELRSYLQEIMHLVLGASRKVRDYHFLATII